MTQHLFSGITTSIAHTLFSRLRVVLVPLLMMALAACGTTVNVDYDQTTNFQKLRSYTLDEQPVKIADDPRLDSPLFRQRLVEALHTHLQARGLRPASPADLRVSYRIDVKQEIESDPSGVSVGIGTYSRNVGIGFGYGFPVSDVESYDLMVLTIDMHGPDDRLLWRGSDTRRLEAGSTPEKSTRLINELVESILKYYPPK